MRNKIILSFAIVLLCASAQFVNAADPILINGVPVGSSYTNSDSNGAQNTVVINEGGIFTNLASFDGNFTVNGGTYFSSSGNNAARIRGSLVLNSGTVELQGGSNIDAFYSYNGPALTINGGTLKGSSTSIIFNYMNEEGPEAVRVGSTGTFDTRQYLGQVQGVAFDSGGDLLFTVDSLTDFSTLRSFWSVDLTGADVQVGFGDVFTTADWLAFDLSQLFDFSPFRTMPSLTGSFALEAGEDWWTKWGDQFTFDIDTTKYEYYVDSATPTVHGRLLEQQPNPVPEPATLLILGLGSLAAVPTIRKRLLKK